MVCYLARSDAVYYTPCRMFSWVTLDEALQSTQIFNTHITRVFAAREMICRSSLQGTSKECHEDDSSQLGPDGPHYLLDYPNLYRHLTQEHP